jgi:cytochrome c553
VRRALGVLALIGGLAAVGVPVRGANVEAGRRKAEACVACHGPDGNASNPAVPSLAGQPALYLHWQLLHYRDRRRADPQMSPFAANLSDADMEDLAAYFAAQRPATPGGHDRPARDRAREAAGRKVAEAHRCAACHGPGLVGQKHIPRLVGLPFGYLLKELRGFKAQTRADVDGTMTMAVQPLSEEDIENLAHYLAHLGPTP